jgi:hypothetical protein
MHHPSIIFVRNRSSLRAFPVMLADRLSFTELTKQPTGVAESMQMSRPATICFATGRSPNDKARLVGLSVELGHLTNLIRYFCGNFCRRSGAANAIKIRE